MSCDFNELSISFSALEIVHALQTGELTVPLQSVKIQHSVLTCLGSPPCRIWLTVVNCSCSRAALQRDLPVFSQGPYPIA